MRTNKIIRNVIQLVVLLGALLAGPVTGSEKEKPNIVVVIADDLGWADVGYNGADFYETPNIDKLAADGMVFNRFYPSAANCAPSRASLLTGTYSPRHQVYIPQGVARGGDVSHMRFKVPTKGQNSTFNTLPVSINNVSPEFESLAEVLKKSGYISARLGKWHIGDDNQGFDVVSAEGEIGKITNFCGDEERYYDDVHVAERLTDAALDFIEENKNTPFFLYLS
ncbi:MAG: sulfatase-like hydrolase/transferase, partial [Prolixibacteraceae bacterium]